MTADAGRPVAFACGGASRWIGTVDSAGWASAGSGFRAAGLTAPSAISVGRTG